MTIGADSGTTSNELHGSKRRPSVRPLTANRFIISAVTSSQLQLPINTALPELRGALATNTSVVLQAPPGAGKSTSVPFALLDEPWLRGRKLVMLEPHHPRHDGDKLLESRR